MKVQAVGGQKTAGEKPTCLRVGCIFDGYQRSVGPFLVQVGYCHRGVFHKSQLPDAFGGRRHEVVTKLAVR